MVTIGLSRTVSEIKGDVRRKSNENRNFSHPRVFNAPAEVVTIGIGYRAGLKKIRMMGLPDGQKSFKIGLTV